MSWSREQVGFSTGWRLFDSSVWAWRRQDWQRLDVLINNSDSYWFRRKGTERCAEGWVMVEHRANCSHGFECAVEQGLPPFYSSDVCDQNCDRATEESPLISSSKIPFTAFLSPPLCIVSRVLVKAALPVPWCIPTSICIILVLYPWTVLSSHDTGILRPARTCSCWPVTKCLSVTLTFSQGTARCMGLAVYKAVV